MSLAPFQADSIGPLTASLQRNELLPFIFNEWSDAAVQQASVFVATAPALPYTSHQLQVLRAFVARGGILLMNAGWEEKGPAMQGLLDEFGLDILRIPLGPFPVNRTENHLANQPQFINAWPVVVTEPAAQAMFEQARTVYRPPVLDLPQAQRLEGLMQNLLDSQGPAGASQRTPPPSQRTPPEIQVLFQTDEHLPLALARRIGKGAVVLIGDTYFLGHDNLESIRFYRQGNILFLKYVFDTLRGRRG